MAGLCVRLRPNSFDDESRTDDFPKNGETNALVKRPHCCWMRDILFHFFDAWSLVFGGVGGNSQRFLGCVGVSENEDAAQSAEVIYCLGFSSRGDFYIQYIKSAIHYE